MFIGSGLAHFFSQTGRWSPYSAFLHNILLSHNPATFSYASPCHAEIQCRNLLVYDVGFRVSHGEVVV